MHQNSGDQCHLAQPSPRIQTLEQSVSDNSYARKRVQGEANLHSISPPVAICTHLRYSPALSGFYITIDTQGSVQADVKVCINPFSDVGRLCPTARMTGAWGVADNRVGQSCGGTRWQTVEHAAIHA